MDIFPVGWAEKNNHKLQPPKGYVASNFKPASKVESQTKLIKEAALKRMIS